MSNKYSEFEDKALTTESWHLIKQALDEGVDVSDIADNRYDADQVQQLLRLRKNGLSIEPIADPTMSSESMKNVVDHILKESGIYEKMYESTRRKWLVNCTWMFALFIVFVTIGSWVYINRDELQKYYEDVYIILKSKNVEIEAGEVFSPASYIKEISENTDVILPDKNAINTKEPGSYSVKYIVSNGKKEKEKELLVNVVDTKAPEIHLKNESLYIDEGKNVDCNQYISSVDDVVDGNLKSKTSCSIYYSDKYHGKITYKAEDHAGNVAKKELLIAIKKKPQQVVVANDDVVDEREDKTSSSSSASNKPSTSTSKPIQKAPVSNKVTAKNKKYYFHEGESSEDVFNKCMQDGNSNVRAGRANSFTCKVIVGENDIYEGYMAEYN